MSDDSSDEAPAVTSKKVKAVAKKAKKAESEDDSSDEDVAPQRSGKKAEKATKAPAVQQDDDDSDDDEPPAKTSSVKAASDRKAPNVEVDSDDSDVEDAPATKPKVVLQDSDDSDDETPAQAAKKQKAAAPAKKGKEEAKAANNKGKAKLEAKDGSEKGPDSTEGLRVFIQGIPYKLKEEELRKDMAKCGPIRNAFVPTNAEGKSKGIAFVTFKSGEGVAAALKLDGNSKKYPGRKLKVEIAQAPTAAPKSKEAQDKAAEKKDKTAETKDRPQDKNNRASKEDEAATKPVGHLIISEKLLKSLLSANQHNDFIGLENLGAKIVRRAQATREARENRSKKMEAKRKKEHHKFAVFVTGLPQTDFDKDAFKRRFQDCGDSIYEWLPVKAGGETKGYGVIAFRSEESFKKALAYNGTKCKGSVLTVRKSTSEKKEPAAENAEGQPGKKEKRKAAPLDDANEAPPQSKKKPKVDAEASAIEQPGKLKDNKKKKAVEESIADAEENVVKKKKKKAE